MRRTLLVALALAAAACSNPKAEVSSNGSSSGGATGATGSTGGSGSSGSTGGSSTGSTGSSGTTGAGGSYRGYVLFNDVDLSGFYTNHTVTAGFADADSGLNLNPLEDCSDGVAEANNCCYRERATDGGSFNFDGGGFNADGGGFNYDAGNFGGYDGGTAPNAGALALTANGSALGTMTPGVGGVYPPFTGTWSAGQQLAVSAAGADVHAFTGTATAPTSAAITSPSGIGTFNPPTVPTNTALLVSWTGAGAKAVVIVGSGLGNGGFAKSVTCYGDNHGQQTISSASMAHFAGDGYGGLLVGVANTTDVSVDNAAVTVAADTVTGGVVTLQ